MKIETKAAEITSVDQAANAPFGSFSAVLSAPTKDRDGDTLYADGWKQPLPDKIVMDIDHTMSVAGTVGSAHPYIDPATGNLMVDGTFASTPLAQEVRTLVTEGHIQTLSVAFMTEKTVKDGVSESKRELLNAAWVAIPSNREAVVLSAKGFNIKSPSENLAAMVAHTLDAYSPNVVPKAGARNAKSDMAHIQAIHDSAIALGAKPATQTDPPEDPNTDDQAAAKSAAELAARKTIAGSVEAGQDRIGDALNDAYPNRYPWPRGTMPAGPDGGMVVFDLYDQMSGDRQTFRQEYTDDGSLVTLVGQPEPVDIMEIVVADADADEDPELQIYTAAAAEARSLIEGIDLTTLPEPVRKALGLLVPTSIADGVKAPRTAELVPTAKALGATETETHARESETLQNWALKFTTYNNFVSRKV